MPIRPPLSCLVALSLSLSAAAYADPHSIPILYGRVEIASGDTPVTLMVVPDGNGPALTQVRTENGEILDGTITLTLLDFRYDPVAMFPGEDIWLESWDDGLAFCYTGPTNPDGDTDQNGQTVWTRPLHAGGWSQALTLVVVNGAPVEYDEQNSQLVAVNLQFNSPDLDGDRTVGLQDLTLFSADFFGGYQFRSDLCRDGVVNLLDLVEFAAAWGAACP